MLNGGFGLVALFEVPHSENHAAAPEPNKVTGGFETETGVGAGYYDVFSGVRARRVGEGGEELGFEEVGVAAGVVEVVSS